VHNPEKQETIGTFYNFYIFSKLYWHRRRRNQIGFFFNNVYNNILIPKRIIQKNNDDGASQERLRANRQYS
jgi:hypothetical protein